MNENLKKYFRRLLKKRKNKEQLTSSEEWLYNLCEKNIQDKCKEFEIDDFVYESWVPTLIKEIKTAGLKKFVVTDRSNILMEVIHNLEKEGFKMMRLFTIERIPNQSEEKEVQSINGVMFMSVKSRNSQ